MAKRTGGRKQGASPGSAPAYVPSAGDLIWLSITPQAGREQAGRRPALVLSPHGYNEKTGLCVVCPVTGLAKGYPFEVPLPDGLAVSGVVLADHVKSADWHARKAEYADRCLDELLAEVRARLKPLLGV